jgi:SAM-dependent methyltransferase
LTSATGPQGKPDLRRLAAGFEREAAAYATSRPGYPDEAVGWLVGSEPSDVLDVGAGSGQLTGSMVASGHRVVATEPIREMLERLRARGLGVPLVQSTAEDLPFRPESFDLVTIATAFHWFDPARSLSQIAGVLRRGGRLALVWNSRTATSGWAAEFGDLLVGAQPDGLVGDWGASSISEVERSELFGRLESAEFAFTQRLDRDGLIGLAASRSYVIALAAPRRRRLLESVGRLFDSAAEASASVDLPYVARCWRCTLADDRA